MDVRIAEHAGYCYGVERALKVTLKASREGTPPIYTLGPIIHNPQVVEALRERGVCAVDNVDSLSEGTVIVRTHGLPPPVVDEARAKGLEVIDATCPFVEKAQQAAAALVKDGYDVVIVGERNHPEVVGILAHAGGQATVVRKAAELASLGRKQRVGVVVQTTQSQETLREIVSALVGVTAELKVFNTICNATAERQRAAEQLAREVDVMLVVGGKNSGNTTRLAQISRSTNLLTHHIETADEIDPEWFAGAKSAGVTAGASTPDWILQEVVDALKSLAGEAT